MRSSMCVDAGVIAVAHRALFVREVLGAETGEKIDERHDDRGPSSLEYGVVQPRHGLNNEAVLAVDCRTAIGFVTT